MYNKYKTTKITIGGTHLHYKVLVSKISMKIRKVFWPVIVLNAIY